MGVLLPAPRDAALSPVPEGESCFGRQQCELRLGRRQGQSGNYPLGSRPTLPLTKERQEARISFSRVRKLGEQASGSSGHPVTRVARHVPAQVLNASAPEGWRVEEAQSTSSYPSESQGDQQYQKNKILKRKKKNQTKKLDFSLHMYNIQIFNTLFHRWLQSTGLERW